MKRTLLVAGLSMAVLLVASVAIIILAPSNPPPTPATPDPSLSPPPRVAVAPEPPRGPVAAEPFKGGRLYLPPTDRAEASTPAANRVTQKAIRKALRAPSVQSQLARCTGVEGFGAASAPGRVPRAAPASLLLELEARGGELRVVDAKVRQWGGASQAMVSCARTVLQSQVIPAPKNRPSAGERMQMHFLLNLRGYAVASG